MKHGVLVFLLLIPFLNTIAQPGWKLAKDKDGIKVYIASNENSKYKRIRVKCTINGTIAKLQNILHDVNHHPDWVYKAKKASMVKQANRNDFTYYSETEMPWPISNRDGIYHLNMNADSLHHSLSVLAVSEPDGAAKKDGIIRIPYSKATWSVTEATDKLNIDYTFEVYPGGKLPAWMVNMFADKGPYETFRNLEKLLTR